MNKLRESKNNKLWLSWDDLKKSKKRKRNRNRFREENRERGTKKIDCYRKRKRLNKKLLWSKRRRIWCNSKSRW